MVEAKLLSVFNASRNSLRFKDDTLKPYITIANYGMEQLIEIFVYCVRLACFTTDDLALAPAGSFGNLGGIGSGLKTFLQSSESTMSFSASLNVMGNMQCLITLLGLFITPSLFGTAKNASSLSQGITVAFGLRRLEEMCKLGRRGF